MLDHVNSYVMAPLSQFLEDSLHVTRALPWLTADHVSYLGVAVALVASRVVLSDALVVRRLSVVVFLFRQLIDDFDGLVARIRSGVDRHQEISIPGTKGYAVDGLCDALGFGVFLLAVFWSCARKTDNKYHLLNSKDDDKSALFRDHVLFGLQMLLSCVLWNRYIDAFHRTLETEVTPIKLQLFKSRLQWLIMWAWRCFGNAHQLMNFLLVSVWLNRSREFVRHVRVVGFCAVVGLSLLTEVHVHDVSIAVERPLE